MLHLVSYDIPNDRRRTKVAKKLVGLGQRVQFSVFLVANRTPAELTRLIEPLLDKSTDNLRIHPLCQSCTDKAILLGTARKPEKPDEYIVI